MSDPNDNGMFSRWSRRKAKAKKGGRRGSAAPVATEDRGTAESVAVEPGPAGSPEVANIVTTDEATKPVDAEEVIAPEDLPDIETLTNESDFTPFLRKGVPEELAKAALRKLWLSDPVFANLDGMNDYDENFRRIDRLIGLADTNYKVGKGFLKDEGEDTAEAGEKTVGADEDEMGDIVENDVGDEAADTIVETDENASRDTDSELG